MERPLIGITTAEYSNPYGRIFLQSYEKNIRAVEQSGGVPILIPHTVQTDSLRALYERVQGILLPGGGDVDPAAYGQANHPATDFIQPQRDQTEITLARWAAEGDKPLFGICRGQQVVNVALGGTLIQDIPSQVKSEVLHYSPPDVSRSLTSHDVRIDHVSLLYRITGAERLDVNSIHHQCIDRVADSLRATACAPDGIIEATELPGHSFYHTVQWHPEDITHIDEMRCLFDALVDAARQRLS